MNASIKKLQSSLDAVNELYTQVESAYLIVYSYFGSTYPSVIDTQCSIRYSDNFAWVTIDGKCSRYSLRNTEDVEDLRYTIRHIKSACKKALLNA